MLKVTLAFSYCHGSCQRPQISRYLVRGNGDGGLDSWPLPLSWVRETKGDMEWEVGDEVLILSPLYFTGLYSRL